MGNIIEVSENGRMVCRYEYDALNRLTREDNVAFGKTTTWTYDNNGNILARYEYAITTKPTNELHLLDCEAFEYGYDNNSDQLLSYNGEAFVYDLIGNPMTYRGKDAVWEYGRQLTSYNGHTFAYDARGRRIAKNDLVFTYDSNGNLIKQSNGLEFLYDHTGVFAVKHGNATYFYRKNAQNDIVALLDNSGAAVVKYRYDAWGNCITTVVDPNASAIANLNPFRYRSYYFDTETGFYFLKTRYYDPVIGRFMTIDDIGYLDPESINSLDLYAYCMNNPNKYIDPIGTSVLLTVGIVIGSLIIAGGIIGGVTAGLNGGSVGEVFAGIGKGMLVGGLFGAAVSMIIAGFTIGCTSVIGSILVTYGISMTANYIEVAVTQVKKNCSDGYCILDGITNVIHSMLANSPRIYIGRFAKDDMTLWGTRLISKTFHLPNLLFDTYELSQYVKAGRAFSYAYDGIFWAKAGVIGLLFGSIMSAFEIYRMGKAIFTQPDFYDSRWILY